MRGEGGVFLLLIRFPTSLRSPSLSFPPLDDNKKQNKKHHSLNIHMSDPNFGKLTSLHFYAWKKGLKTGMYYLRTRAAADAIKFTVDVSALKSTRQAAAAKAAGGEGAAAADGGEGASRPLTHEEREAQLAAMVCSLENKEACISCGS